MNASDKPDRSFRKIRPEIIKDPVPGPTRPNVSGIAHQRRHLTSRALRRSKDLWSFSEMETLALLGLVSNLVQFVTFAKELISTSFEIVFKFLLEYAFVKTFENAKRRSDIEISDDRSKSGRLCSYYLP